MGTVVMISIGGGIGAVLRHIVVVGVPTPPNRFPIGVTAVNVFGSVLLGVVIGADVARVGIVDVDALTIGVLGGFTTFSTWMVDIDRAASRGMAGTVAAVPTILGIVAAAAGVMAGLLMR